MGYKTVSHFIDILFPFWDIYDWVNLHIFVWPISTQNALISKLFWNRIFWDTVFVIRSFFECMQNLNKIEPEEPYLKLKSLAVFSSYNFYIYKAKTFYIFKIKINRQASCFLWSTSFKTIYSLTYLSVMHRLQEPCKVIWVLTPLKVQRILKEASYNFSCAQNGTHL